VNYIIFDLEATCWEHTPPGYVQEIIEIGAVLVDEYGDAKSQFSAFVRPRAHPNLSPYCLNLTNISQIDVNRARALPDILNMFMDWAKIDFEEYTLCSWGDFDQKLLAAESLRHDFDDAWTTYYVNLKSEYRALKGLPKAIGLKRAVEHEGFEFTGEHHRALSDAQNLAKVFAKYLRSWEI
jgi:3'-5' exoribonuclease 1